MAKTVRLPIAISRTAPAAPLSPFTDYFQGFERVQAVRDVFGDQTEKVLAGLKVGFISNRYMYMGVSDDDGSLRVGTYHLKNSDLRTLYLDVVHELFHVKQFMDDKEYFHREHQRYLKKTGFDSALYFKSPIEVPAYRHAVEEAKRIGMSFGEIAEYLKMGPVHPKVFSQLLKNMGLERTMRAAPPVKPRVRIKRNVSVRLYPFTDYFKGFEQMEAVRTLFGDGTDAVLNQLKVEFSSSPIRIIAPDEEDGHLQVSVPYLRTGDPRLVYFDVLVCLNLLKRISEGAKLADGEDPDFANSRVFLDSYRAAVKEGRRLEIPNAELIGHMMMPRFVMTPAEFQRFVGKVGLG